MYQKTLTPKRQIIINIDAIKNLVFGLVLLHKPYFSMKLVSGCARTFNCEIPQMANKNEE